MKLVSVESIFGGVLRNHPHQTTTRLANAARSFLHDRAVHCRIKISIWKRNEEVSRKAFADLGRAREPVLNGYFVENSLQRTEFIGLVGAFGGVTIHSRPLSFWGGSGIAFNDGALGTSRPYHQHTRLLAKVESDPAGPTTRPKGVSE